MAMKKKSAKRMKTSKKTAGERIRETWAAINSRETRAKIEGLGTRFDRERKRAVRHLEARLKELQSRVGKERKNLAKNVAKMVEDGVQSALAALNIPSRKEVANLTAKVEQLSRKLDTVRRK